MKVHAAVSPPPSLGGVILRGEFTISRMLGCELEYSFGGRRGARFPSESFNNLDSSSLEVSFVLFESESAPGGTRLRTYMMDEEETSRL